MVITAANNTRLSRKLLWGLILLYILPGLFARTPWKPDDAAGFGQSFTLSQLPFSQWALSSIGDRLYVEGGLLSAWLAGLIGKFALFVNLPYRWLDDAMRLGNVFWMILAAWAIWNTTYRLAKRVELQPEDPLGTAPTRVDYARSVADASVLCLLGTLGLLVRSHMQVPEVAELAGISIMLLGAVRSLDRPIGAGWLLGIGITISFFARGWAHWLPFLLLLLINSSTLPSLRFGLLRRITRATAVFTIPFAIWFFWLISQENGELWWNAWNEWNIRRFLFLDPTKSFDLPSLVITLKTLTWFLWPILPMACWTMWRYRKALSEPSIRIPLAGALAGIVVLVITNPADEANYFPLLPPLSVLAAIGLSTMKRGLISLIDWFAVLWFTFAAVLVWLGWTAVTFGFPTKIAANFEKLSPGYIPETIGLELTLAMLASLAWARLIVWRTTSRSQSLWRPMVLSSGGVILLWLLMMTLWIPRIDYAKSFKSLGFSIAESVKTHPRITGQKCIADYNLGYAQRATLQYHARINFVRKEQFKDTLGCEYLLIQDSTRQNLRVKVEFESNSSESWELIWSGNRNSDRHEFFFMYARTKH
jgi:hypothetical protein